MEDSGTNWIASQSKTKENSTKHMEWMKKSAEKKDITHPENFHTKSKQTTNEKIKLDCGGSNWREGADGLNELR